jgi:hypothetical protein
MYFMIGHETLWGMGVNPPHPLSPSPARGEGGSKGDAQW